MELCDKTVIYLVFFVHLFIFSDSASVRHASLANVLNYFQQIFAESDERVIKILARKIKPRARSKLYEDIDNKIQNTLTEYENMVDSGQISDAEFGQSTNSFLNRLSYLILQMDSSGHSTRKDHKIREV